MSAKKTIHDYIDDLFRNKTGEEPIDFIPVSAEKRKKQIILDPVITGDSGSDDISVDIVDGDEDDAERKGGSVHRRHRIRIDIDKVYGDIVGRDLIGIDIGNIGRDRGEPFPVADDHPPPKRGGNEKE